MIRVVKAGLFTTVQDLGRYHYRNKGVPVSGAMDAVAVHKANSLLENDLNAAVLEITMTGPTLLFEEPIYVAISGADLSVTLNNAPIKNYKVYKIVPGDVLSYGRLEKGFRGYLAVKGGFLLPQILGSRSYYAPVTPKNKVVDGDLLPFVPVADFGPKISEIKVDSYLDDTLLGVYKGPEFEMLPQGERAQLFNRVLKVAKENNRMAYQLQENCAEHQENMLTAATMPGTVQWTPSGKLIILMKDGQTTGGYPRILQLSDAAIAILAQKKTGDSIQFNALDQ
jgi:biotin-dependent carboxylase-like uncharacterized protein